ncbi:MAG: hypothetical protein QXG46_05245 [Ignisphaera sp.]|uniref:Uncharacterized protein n=1 Tax=Ignisphaera aggregans TaxID=334771 RepID=A0A7C4H6S5_9CREN
MSYSLWKPTNITNNDVYDVSNLLINILFTSISKVPQLVLILSILSIVLIATGIYLLEIEKFGNKDG